jgi:hypothetical protein
MWNKVKSLANNKAAGILLLIVLIAIPGLIQACAKASPSYEVISLNMTPTTAITGAKVTVQVEVKNTNSERDTYTIPLMVDGVTDSRQTVTLDPGQTELLTFELTRSHAGVFRVSVGSKESTLKVVKTSPANFILSDLQISPTQVDMCESVVVNVDVANTGNSQGVYTAELKIDGVTDETQKLTVPAGANCPLCFKVARSLAGTYVVTIGNLSGQFTVKEPPTPVFDVPVAPTCPPDTYGTCTPRG